MIRKRAENENSNQRTVIRGIATDEKIESLRNSHCEENQNFPSPLKRTPNKHKETNLCSDNYDYFGNISAFFGKSGSHSFVKFEDMFKSPDATPLKEGKISSFNRNIILNFSSGKKKSSENPKQPAQEMPSLIMDHSIREYSPRFGQNESPSFLPPTHISNIHSSIKTFICVVCESQSTENQYITKCCDSHMCFRCHTRFYIPSISTSNHTKCPFCTKGQLKEMKQDEGWSI